MTTTTITPLYATRVSDVPLSLGDAYEGSYYTIAGAGGDLADWVTGLTDALTEAGIGVPAKWFTTTGESVNAFASSHGPVADRDRFQPDLVFLLFPLDGLDVGKLAMFKLMQQDRWFDDVIDNMVR